MQNKAILILTECLFVFLGSQAQSPDHKFYPKPELTSKVVKLQQERVKFKPKKSLSATALPASVDNSVKKYFPPIIDQMGGSCAQASGIGYMFTFEMNRLLDRDAKASTDNQFSYQFSWNMLNGGQDEGGFVEEGLNLAKNYGMMTLQDYGSSGTYQFRWASGYDKYLKAMRYRTKEVYIFDDSIPLMKRYLYDAGDGSEAGGILTFSGQSSWTINNNYSGTSATGYHSLLTKLGTSGAHAVTIVGYDDLVTYTDDNGTVHNGAFIVVNTWGSYSHDNGRFYLPYDFFRDPNIPSTQLSNTVVGVKVCTYTPQVVFRVTLDYSSRDDLYFGVGTTDDPSRVNAKSYQYYNTFFQQGGDYPMQGQYLSSNIELAFDITPYLPTSGTGCKKYFFNVVRGFKGKKKGTGQLLKLSVIDYRGKEPIEYTCSDELPYELKDGANIFSVPIRDYTIGVSPYRYLDATGNTTEGTFLMKTGKGNKAKIRFTNHDAENQTISIRYQVKTK